MNTLYMMIGLPASGKSTYAKKISQETGAQIVSSDEIRKELWGSYDDREHNNETFRVVEDKILEELEKGDVVYDATNLNYKRRMNFLQRLKGIEKVAVLMLTPYEECSKRNNLRQRKVPDEAMERMYFNIDIPLYYEGFDEIIIKRADCEIESLKKFFKRLKRTPQYNPHHTLTIGNHCKKAAMLTTLTTMKCEWSIEDFIILYNAALVHDIGKEATRTFCDYNGNWSNIAHYYGHEHVSAYLALLYSEAKGMLEPDSSLEITLKLVRWHMQMHKDMAGHTVEKYKRLLGERTWNLLKILGEADSNAR